MRYKLFRCIDQGESWYGNDKDGKPIINYYFAGKVKIGDNDKIVFVRTRKNAGRANRFYVHEVFTEEEIIKLGANRLTRHPIRIGNTGTLPSSIVI